MEGLDDVKRELETKRQELEDELKAARGKVASIEDDLSRVDEALSSLMGKKAKAKSKPKKPAPTLEELREVVAAVRVEQPFANDEELEKAVRARLKKSDRSLAGFKDLYAEALREPDAFEMERMREDRFRQAG